MKERKNSPKPVSLTFDIAILVAASTLTTTHLPLSPFSIPHHTAHLRSASLTPYLTLSLTNTDHNSPSPPLTDSHRCCLPRHQPIGHQNRSERKTLASPPLLRTRFYSNPSFQEVFTHHLVGLLRSHRSS
ncbi:hypothetical protein PIB30_082668 [Stylosanthes scabra]|uniref:Uncharacterized protein n=1 Tax=Stylosanthes scabra TaxID=79078 RepID=A0ABU6ZQQ9_9FABA|nr:hypothetical protein [Stylosanthes scabra]